MKDKQHIVPRTYLKYWKIADNKSFVYGIDFSNKYKTGVQTFGLNDKVFIEKRYYNHPSFENPYIIEDVLGEEIEPIYDEIMAEIISETNLSIEIREKIIQWLYVSKMRSPYMRNNTEKVANVLFKTTELYKKKDISPEKESAIEQHSKEIAKEIQLSTFAIDGQLETLLNLFTQTLIPKHWRILKSAPPFEFLTNDNPGFSPNTIERFSKDLPYHNIIELNSHSIIFYPLSPKYCLEITPFIIGTSLDTTALTMEIKYEQALPELIEFINKGVLHTCNKVLVSNNKEILEHCVKQQ